MWGPLPPSPELGRVVGREGRELVPVAKEGQMAIQSIRGSACGALAVQKAAVDGESHRSGHCRPMEGTRAFLIPG